LVSILVGAVAAVWIGHVVSAPAGLIAGIALYIFSMIVCYFALLHGHQS